MQISIANIIRGTLIGNTMSVLTRYISRVVNGGGIVESPQCVETALNSQPLLQQASLLVVPSGYKGGTLYSEIPTNGNGDLTWTRGSDAFRTNASGLIQRVPWNLLQRSEEFTNAVWNTTGATITANSINAPNGTLTADTITQTGATLNVSQSFTISSLGNYTYSSYVKRGNFDSSSLFRFGVYQGTDIGYITYNFATNTTSVISGTFISHSSTNVGDGWYRIQYTINLTSTGTAIFYNGGVGGSIGTNNFFYSWGTQLDQGTTAQTYLPTTDRLNFPRLSYMYGSCPSVLLEPQRTNLALRSEEFDNASWSKTNTTITANTSATLDPSGNNNADKFIANNNNGAHFISQGSFASAAYSFTVYAKAAEETSMSLWLRNAAVGATFNLSNGTVSNVNVTSATITSVGNGWYRCFVYDSTAGTTAHIYGRSGSGYIGNNVDGFYLYGAQLEAGAYPTTYIPTTSATATRVADSFSRNNIFTNGLITSSGGTWFVELRNNIVYTRDTVMYLGVGDTSTLNSNAIFIMPGVTSLSVIRKRVAGAESTLFTTTTSTVKIAIKWNGTSCDVFANGTKVVSASPFTTTNMEWFTGSATAVPMFIQQMALYPSALSDTDCTTLTTL